MKLREAQEPHALRRADHRVDDRARGAAAAKERRLVSAVIYNRLKQGMPLGIDATTATRRTIGRARSSSPSSTSDEPYNTRLNRGLPPTPIGNPGPGVDQGRRQAVQEEVPVLRAQAAASPASTRSPRPTRSSRRTSRATRRPAADGMIRLGVCGWPVAHSRSPQMHNAALAHLGSTTGATRRCRSRRTCSRRPCERCRRRLPGRERDDPAQGGGARARGRRDRDGQGDRRRQHAHVRARRRDPRRQHRRAGLPEPRSTAPPTRRPRSCSAPAAPPAPCSTRSSRRGPTSSRVEPHRRRAQALADEFGAVRRCRSRPTSSSTARRVGLARPVRNVQGAAPRGR